MTNPPNSPYWNPLLSQLTPYIPGEQPKSLNDAEPLLKLNTNENPYPPSPKVLAAVSAALGDSLRLYPDPNSNDLKQKLAEYYSVSKDEIFVGNGSDEVLGHIFHAFFKGARGPILFPEVTYSFYPVYSRLYEATYRTIPMREDLSIDVSHYQQSNGGIIFPNPNAPTGRYLALPEIMNLAKSQANVNPNTVVVIDEAYIDFGGESAVSLVKQCPNLLVVQTFSKSRSLAGMRLGFAIGQPHLIEGLNRVKNSFNSYPVDRLAEIAGIAALKDDQYFHKTRQQIIQTRENFARALTARNCHVLPSAANFVLVKPPPVVEGTMAECMTNNAIAWAGHLRKKSIIVRHFPQAPIEHYLRVSIGTEAQMKKFLDVVDSFL